ncbi:MAG: ATP-binding protein, partial [Planctomycetota bacterium]
ADRREHIETIRRNGEYLLAVINDVLDVSKIEAGQLHVERLPTNAAQLVEEVAALASPRAQIKGISLSVSYTTAIPALIECDPVRLRQILLNLVGNAIKFTDTGGVSVRVACDAAAGTIAFRVVDTGIGMTDEQRKLVATFRPFNQADASTTRLYGGTGLGLRITNALTTMLGGSIDVESEPGRGSAFTVTLPTGDLRGVPMTVPGVAPADASKERTPTRPEDARPPRPLEGIRILLAEDGLDNQRLISYQLKRAGASVVVCNNGLVAAETIEAATTEDLPHVVLMDIQMPELDGYSATRRLRSGGFNLPIIAVTAHAMDGDRKKCIDAGCDDYLTKPIDTARMIDACARFAASGRHMENARSAA